MGNQSVTEQVPIDPFFPSAGGDELFGLPAASDSDFRFKVFIASSFARSSGCRVQATRCIRVSELNSSSLPKVS